MKIFKIAYTIILVIILTVSTNLFSQEINAKQDRVNSLEDFKIKYSKAIVKWDNKNATPKRIQGVKISKYVGTPTEIAKQFLIEEKKIFGFEDFSKSFKFKKNNYSERGGARIQHTQFYEGVVVLNSGYLIGVNKSNEIYFVSGEFYPDIAIKTNENDLNASTLTGILDTRFSANRYSITKDFQKFILPNLEGDIYSFSVIYEAEIQTDNPIDFVKIRIDAKNGEIIEEQSLIRNTYNGGKVYETSPAYDTTVVTEQLFRIFSGSPRMLDGTHVEVLNYTGSEASNTDGFFYYLPTNTHFDEVMLYHQCDNFEEYMIDLGLGSESVSQVTAYTNANTVTYAGTNSSAGIIYLSNGIGFSGLRNPTHDATAIAHEYMHVVSYSYNALDQNDEARALDEAYCDYFSVSYVNRFESMNTSVMGEWFDEDGEGELVRQRDLDNSYNYSEYSTIDYEPNDETEEHDRSLIFTGALWDFRSDQNTNPERVDAMILESLNNLDANTSFEEAREAIEDAILEWEGDYMDYLYDVGDAFYAHGIGDEPPDPLSVSISGPGFLLFKATGTFTATGSGGFFPPYTYTWYKKNDGAPSWTYSGTGSTKQFTMGTTAFTLKTIVTDDNDDTAEDTHYVDNSFMKKAPGDGDGKLMLPEEYSLGQNYPNPFNPTTIIKYDLKESGFVRLNVYNVKGQVVKKLVNKAQSAGRYESTFDASSLPSGLYYYSLEAGSFKEVKKMILMK